MAKGWYREPLRHSNAKKFGKAGGTYKKRIVLGNKPKTIYDSEDLTDKQLSKLTERQVHALEKGDTLKSDTIIADARKEQIRDLEKRYKLLATSKAVGDVKELEQYREDKANYLQYLNEKKKTDEYLLKIKNTKEETALQILGEDLIRDLDKESPRTTKFLRENPDVKLHFVEEEDFQKFMVGEKGDTYSGARNTNGIYDNIGKKIYVSVDIDEKLTEKGFFFKPKDRARTKEVIVHEVAHAKRDKAFWKNFKQDWRNVVKPQIRERWNLYRQKKSLGSGEYKSRLRQLDEKFEVEEIKFTDLEYVSYHYQGRMRRRIHKPFVEEVKRRERAGDYRLDNYHATENNLRLVKLPF